MDPQTDCGRPATPLVDSQDLVGRCRKPRVGTKAPDKAIPAMCWRKEKLRRDIAEPELRSNSRERANGFGEPRLRNHRSDPASNQVVIRCKLDRDYGLDEKHVLRLMERAHSEVGVVLVQNAIQARKRILSLLILGIAGRLPWRSPCRRSCSG